MSLKPTDVKRVILQEDDFGHEMRVGHIFSTVRPDVPNPAYNKAPEHGGTYTNLLTGKPRQFDYRFQIRNSESPMKVEFIASNELSAIPQQTCSKPLISLTFLTHMTPRFLVAHSVP